MKNRVTAGELAAAMEAYFTAGMKLEGHRLHGDEIHQNVDEAFKALRQQMALLLNSKELIAFIEAYRVLIVYMEANLEEAKNVSDRNGYAPTRS